MPVGVNVCHDVKLINRKVFLAFPFLILGICINETLILGKNKDWTGLFVTTLTLMCCFIYFTTFGVRNNCRPHCFWSAFMLMGITVMASLVFLVIIMTEAELPNHVALNRPRLSTNGTGCREEDLRNVTGCNDIWIQEAKSSWSLCTSNLALLINAILSFTY